MRRPLPVRHPSREVSIVSFNMLLKGFDQKPYYPEVGPELRNWARRRQELKALLLGIGADIYCMQEVEVSSFEEEFAWLAEAGYGAVAPRDEKGAPKGKKPGADASEGGAQSIMAKCAIFFRADRFEVVWYENRSRAVVAALTHLPSGRLLYVVSCHLEGAPSEAAARVNQTKSALERVRLDQRRRGVDPATCCLVFAGDFNGDETSAVCHLLRTGGLTTDFRDPWAPEAQVTKADFTHEYTLTDLYAPSPPAEGSRQPTFCCPASKRFAAIDFVFYSERTLSPAAIRLPFTEEQAAATHGVGIPSEWHFSDHVPLGGVLAFREPEEGPDKTAAVELV